MLAKGLGASQSPQKFTLFRWPKLASEWSYSVNLLSKNVIVPLDSLDEDGSFIESSLANQQETHLWTEIFLRTCSLRFPII